MAYNYIDGSDPIEVCALPTGDKPEDHMFVDGEVLENPKSVKADLKDDLAAYNAKMLENMSEFFQAQVESKSAGAKKIISPDGESCAYGLQPTLADSSCQGEEKDHVVSAFVHTLPTAFVHPLASMADCDTTPCLLRVGEASKLATGTVGA